MNISIRMSDVDAQLIKTYAEHNNETVTDFLRRTAFEEIKKEYGVLLGEEKQNENSGKSLFQ